MEGRRLAGSIGGHTTHSLYSSDEIAARARDGALRRFEKQVDPEGLLEPQERGRRAQHARAAWMRKLAIQSANARRTR